VIAPAAILFDWDNTLVDNWGAIQAAMNAALRAFELPEWDREETLRRVRASMRDGFPRIFGADWPRARELFYTAFAEEHLAWLQPLAGAEACLDAAAAVGAPCALVSNKRGDFLRREADYLGWSDRFAAMIGAGDAPRDKPAADPALAALDAIGVGAGPSVWFVGDTETDVDCALAAGLTPILVDGTPGVPDRPQALRFVSLSEIAAALHPD